MPQDFSGKNLQGCCFRGQDLTGANFSHSDIRGANFANTTLISANFSHAKAGLQYRWAISLVIASLLLSALSGFASAIFNTFARYWFSTNQNIDPLTIFLGVIFLILFSAFFVVTFILTIHQSLASRAVPWILTLAGAGPLAGAVALSVVENRATAVVVTVTWAAGLVVASALALAVVLALANALVWVEDTAWTLARAWVLTVALGLAFALARIWTLSAVAEAKVRDGGDLAGAIAVALPAGYVGWQALAGDEKFALVKKIAVAFSATRGTNFRNADLTDANFTSATLKSTDLRGAILTRTRWYQAKKVDRARVGDSILIKPSVRDLLVSGNGYKKSYERENLRGANLAGANLNETNLRDADISQAILQGTNLEGANLTKVQAVGADFTNAYLTGACLEAWNIDSTTQLEEVECRYVYLMQGKGERCPSSGEFKPGEFTTLFQEFLNTVDLIFRNGVDWKAFATAFKKVQIENEGTELAIQSIENKGDGAVVVKVSVPPDANKEKTHSDFTRNYELALKAIEEKYQAKLEAKDEVIVSYRQQLEDYRYRERQQNAELKEIISMLASKPMNLPVNIPEVKAIAERQSNAGKLVILTLGDGDFERGFPSVTAQIWTEGDRLPTQCLGQLPPEPKIPELYSSWQSIYQSLGWHSRIKSISIQVTNINSRDIYPLAEELEDCLNQWLNSETFRPIDKSLREKFVRSDEVQVIIQSENIQVRRLPWHLWDFFKSYRKAEVALSALLYDRVEKTAPLRDKKRVLAILGDSTGINLEEDRKVLENFNNAETVFLVEPTRQELDKHLWNEQGWDILCFSGHSSSHWDSRNGWIYINQADKLTINQLENALRAAIERGLQLAIFNSCDGLGLARQLASLHIPQIIVMREPVPDLVAQEFLKNFLRAFANGKSFYVAVRQAREMLQGLENDFPCATWLPVICQNPAEQAIGW